MTAGVLIMINRNILVFLIRGMFQMSTQRKGNTGLRCNVKIYSTLVDVVPARVTRCRANHHNSNLPRTRHQRPLSFVTVGL